jgi:hypothetical protein
VNDAHRKAAEQLDLAAHSHRAAAEHNEKRADAGGGDGIRNEHWSTRITLTNWPRRPHQVGREYLIMSTRYNDGSHDDNHQRAAELDDGAAHAHRVAEQQGKEDHQTGHEHSRQALEHSQDAHEHSNSTKGEHGIAAFGHDDIASLAHEFWRARGVRMDRRTKIGFVPRKNCDHGLAV